jgi:hypothetical protein
MTLSASVCFWFIIVYFSVFVRFNTEKNIPEKLDEMNVSSNRE